eukprot:jgi/Mesen1/1854/ME000143S00910
MAGMGDGYVGSSADSLRIRRLEKARDVEKKRTEDLKKKIADGQSGLLQFGQGTSEVLESAFKKETVGLVTREQFAEKRASLRSKLEEEERRERQRLADEEEERLIQRRKKRRATTGAHARLSFADEIDDDEDGELDELPSPAAHVNGKSDGNGAAAASAADKKKRRLAKYGKDPTVETGFLPDREREAQEQAEREVLAQDWLAQQERIKNEALQITYSYWDGAGHRRVLQARKGDSIGEFLRAVQQQLAPEFREVRTSAVENLLYIKEDLIIPHLFHFDVHEDIRTIADATIEKDESHAGKVVERHWYDKNKHIFPASRWEIYDPTKKWERYTIHGT